MEILKVSTRSKPSSVAGALANAFKTKNQVQVQAIGAGAINQAIKAIAIARLCGSHREGFNRCPSLL